ncbi:hypothetical protein M768_20550 [Cellulosimicrobium cellulans F16]|uniref:Uncharacterized protein n=1 Tax=Cellulosimicrobium cellulans F16 TaxID=1350482 RepID=A0A0M0F5Z3_CELCE|nr:hypothetical protein M768_20550 [Cellulosimicrobium cellulans F16]
MGGVADHPHPGAVGVPRSDAVEPDLEQPRVGLGDALLVGDDDRVDVRLDRAAAILPRCCADVPFVTTTTRSPRSRSASRASSTPA